MELNRIAKRSFRVISNGSPIGIIQKHKSRRDWYFMPFEGCGISKSEMVFKRLSQLKAHVSYLNLLKTS